MLFLVSPIEKLEAAIQKMYARMMPQSNYAAAAIVAHPHYEVESQAVAAAVVAKIHYMLRRSLKLALMLLSLMAENLAVDVLMVMMSVSMPLSVLQLEVVTSAYALSLMLVLDGRMGNYYSTS